MAQHSRGWQLGRRIAPPRFVVFVVLTIAGAAAATLLGHQWSRALMLGFDLGSAVFLASLWPLFDDASDAMRERAAANDANRAGLLALTGIVSLVILAAVASELSGNPRPATIALVIATLALAWLFSNTVYALHYAHLFYSRGDGGDAGGIDVPNTNEPDYWDFLYFSYTLGMTFQTSDIGITARAVRRVVLGQCLAAFVFNLGIIAFTINVLGAGK